jgi:outer membrane protein assembly factor BamB
MKQILFYETTLFVKIILRSIVLLCFIHLSFCYSQDFSLLSDGKIKSVELIIPSFLGGEGRNYYGNEAPNQLDLLWKFYLGKGKTVISKKIGEKEWAGSGWTGQSLLVSENDQLFLIQSALDHHLRKIDAASGKMIWSYKFDDVIKGTGTLWINNKASDLEKSVIILQGSRRGLENDLYSKYVPSFRAVSYFSGKELWRMNVTRTASYSRDVDGSALIIDNTAYIGLENALFTIFNPDPIFAKRRQGMIQPKIYKQIKLFQKSDQIRHGGNLVVESSPALLDKSIYITAGSGHVYGYDLKRDVLNWDFYIGSDMDGSPVVTKDSCLIVTVEKQYIEGHGGVFKLDPRKPPSESVVWYFPTGDDSVESWQGGVIGSASINDRTRESTDPFICAFIGIDGYLYVVNQRDLDYKAGKITGPNKKIKYAQPKLLFKKQIGPSISTPIIIKNKIIATGYQGIYLFEFDKNLNFNLIDQQNRSAFESTAIVYNKRIYVGAKDGFLYCFGEKD